VLGIARTPKPDYDLIEQLEKETGISAGRIVEAVDARHKANRHKLAAVCSPYVTMVSWLRYPMRTNLSDHFVRDHRLCDLCCLLTVVSGLSTIAWSVVTVLLTIEAFNLHDPESIILSIIGWLVIPQWIRLVWMTGRHMDL